MVISFLGKLPHIMLYFQICLISFFGNVFTPCNVSTPCLVCIPAGGGLSPLSSFPSPAVTSTDQPLDVTYRSLVMKEAMRVLHEVVSPLKSLNFSSRAAITGAISGEGQSVVPSVRFPKLQGQMP